MDTTVIVGDLAARLRSAGGPDGLWVSEADARRIGGWELGPEGACQGSRCVPLPPGVVRDGLLDLAGLARYLGQPVVHDSTHQVWVIKLSRARNPRPFRAGRSADLCGKLAPVGAEHALREQGRR